MSVNCDLLDVAEIENNADNSNILNEEEEKMLLDLENSGTSISTAGQTARYVEKFRSFLKNNSKNSNNKKPDVKYHCFRKLEHMK
jgi:hypothetical protein